MKKVSYWLVAACLAASVLFSAASAQAKRFIQPDAPTVKVKPFEGEHYEALVPDTLDLAERARLAVHGLTSDVDPKDDYFIWWLVNFHNSPPMAMKDGPIMSLTAKFIESLPLMRMMSGSTENSFIDPIWMNMILKMTGPDGLLYQRQVGNEPFESLSSCAISRAAGAMLVFYMRDHNPMWKENIQKIFDRLSELSIDKGDYCYFGQKRFTVNEKVDKNKPEQYGIVSVDEMNSRMMQPAGIYYAMTGYEPAKKLGDKIFNFVRYHSKYFGPNGEWLKDLMDGKEYPGRTEDNHFGTHSHSLVYMAEFALATHNQDQIDWVKKSFEEGMRRNSNNGGMSETATRIGFFQEYSNPYYPTAETCSVADMVAVGVKLSAAGAGDYWDDVDRWTRNHLIELQITSTEFVDRIKSPAWPRKPEANETADHVAENNVGNFMSWPTANDAIPSRPMEDGAMWACPQGIMHCCTGNGTRALWYMWENILACKDGQLKVNLLLNRASQWADVDSYIPYVGRVDVKVKTALQDVSVRVPEWVKSGSAEIKATVNGKARELAWGGQSGRYVSVGKVKKGETVSLTFPIAETSLKRVVYGAPHATVLGGIEYERLVFRGNTVVHIEPEGKNMPLYQRDVYRTGVPRFIKVDRFITKDQVYY